MKERANALSVTRTEVAEPLANLGDGRLPGRTQAVITVPILFLVGGLLVGVAFGFDVGRTASGLASRHFRNARRHPRYYRVTDPWLLSAKTVYWRSFGAVFGAVFIVLGGISLVAALGIGRS